MKYNIILNYWRSKIANIKVTVRHNAAFTVFEGQFVISGGYKARDFVTSVKAYDYHENKQTFFSQSSLQKRGYHSAVSMGNKMFVIGNHVGYKNS